jgi:hypothetical protein
METPAPHIHFATGDIVTYAGHHRAVVIDGIPEHNQYLIAYLDRDKGPRAWATLMVRSAEMVHQHAEQDPDARLAHDPYLYLKAKQRRFMARLTEAASEEPAHGPEDASELQWPTRTKVLTLALGLDDDEIDQLIRDLQKVRPKPTPILTIEP